MLPTHANQKSLADSFNDFYLRKIEHIRSGLTDPQCPVTLLDPLVSDVVFTGTKLTCFSSVSEAEVEKVVLKSVSK